MKSLSALLFLIVILSGCDSKKSKSAATDKDPQLGHLKLPPGFRISYFAGDVQNARSLALGANGTVFAGNRQGKNVYALVDADHDGVAEKKYTVAEGLKMPNGVAFRNGSLYIAEVNRISRIDNIESTLDHPAKPVVINDSLPSDEHHGWKYIGFGPDDKLYVPVGAPCNVCNDSEKDPRYASIIRMNADGTGFEIFAHGIRNSVGFAWNPQTKDLWFTDNGRDELGDNLPPDELNIADKKGEHFGFPYCNFGELPDPRFGKGHSCSEFKAPAGKLTPHGASLGMKFYTGAMFPEKYRNQIFIAEHGSWNRSQPIGYRIMLATVEGNKVISYAPFVEGWLKNNEAWGRPVDVLVLKDGSMLVSDDLANAIYRITYHAKS